MLEFLKYLRNVNIKIEDSILLDELWDLIEKKLIINDYHYLFACEGTSKEVPFSLLMPIQKNPMPPHAL